MNDPLGLVTPFSIAPGRTGRLVSLPELERRGFGPVSRLPVSLRIVLESLARNVDGQRVTEEDVRALERRAERRAVTDQNQRLQVSKPLQAQLDLLFRIFARGVERRRIRVSKPGDLEAGKLHTLFVKILEAESPAERRDGSRA